MYKFDIPVAFWAKQVESAKKIFDSRVPRDLKRIALDAATFAREHHSYITRHPSGGLERNTVGKVDRVSKSNYVITLEFNKEYAQYVEARGLTDSDKAKEYAQRKLLAYLNSVPKMLREAR